MSRRVERHQRHARCVHLEFQRSAAIGFEGVEGVDLGYAARVGVGQRQRECGDAKEHRHRGNFSQRMAMQWLSWKVERTQAKTCLLEERSGRPARWCGGDPTASPLKSLGLERTRSDESFFPFLILSYIYFVISDVTVMKTWPQDIEDKKELFILQVG
jgi:hypothetical protein